MKDNIYFDNAATTWPKPESVYTFMDAFFRTNGVNPGRGGHAMSTDAEAMTYATRQMLAAFFGFSGDANRVIFTLNGTDSLNIALNGLLSSGDHMITTRIEHNAVLRISNHLERDASVDISRVAVDQDGYVSPHSIAQAIQPNTKVIVVNHASNVIGTVQPLSQIAQIAREYNVKLVVDTAQSAGLLPIDMDKLGIDVLTFTGHKGLFGPMGIGGLIVSDNTELRPARVGGTGVNSISNFQPDVYPHKLEAGTVPLPGIAGLHAAQLWFRALGKKQQLEAGVHDDTIADKDKHHDLCSVAIDHIHKTEMTLLFEIESWLNAYPAVQVLGNARTHERVANLSFVVEGMASEQLGAMLDADHHICVRAGLHCAPLVHVDAGTADTGGAVRISPGYFTDSEDMHRLRTGLDDLLRTP